MKRTLIILLLLVGTLGIAGTTQAYSNVSFSFSYHDALGPYGTWVNVSNYGNVFRPNVYAGWRPYTVGHWVYTDYGPMWDTAEPFGWATYHYGHWIFTAAYGWVWVPGYDYYPSRVSWAYGDDYLGWSPIYPNPGYSNVNFWVFIDRDHYGYNNYSPYYLRGDRVRPLFDRRVVRVHDDYRWDRGDFERVIRRPVQVVKVREQNFQADQRRVRLVVPATRESQVIREVSRAAKVRNKDVNRHEDSRSKVVVSKRPAEKSKFSTSKKVELQQSSKSKAVKKSEPKAIQSNKHSSKPSSSKHSTRSYSYDRSGSDKKYKVERSYSPKSKAFVKSTAPKKSSTSHYSKYSAPKKSSTSHYSKYSTPKKSSTSEAKFTSNRADVKPKTSYTSNKKSVSKHTQSKQKSVKKPSQKPHKKH